uniref:Uncharacterized protein n=1 Tax=Anguilla anguilla TaxID=7936 RepID=A0A0E9PPQ4_ANGAN
MPDLFRGGGPRPHQSQQ